MVLTVPGQVVLRVVVFLVEALVDVLGNFCDGRRNGFFRPRLDRIRRAVVAG